MATKSYENALQMAESLSREEKVRLIQELMSRVADGEGSEPQHSILELRGLGKEIWKAIDAQEYVRRERDSWNG